MNTNSYFLFLIVAFFYISSPGLAIFLTIQYAAVYNYKKILMLILGNISGLAVLAFISAIGVGIIISTSLFLTNIIKYIGALVLLYIGIKMIINSSKISNKKTILKHKSSIQFYKEGLFLALTNPKPIIFFTSIYPQFVQSNDNKYLYLFILAITFMSLSFLILNAYAIVSKNTIGKILNEQRTNIFNRISGIALIITALFIVIF